MEKEFLGNFKIIRKVGEGGMAVAFLAHHKEIPDHRVILKLLKDPRHGEKFKKEANNLAKLNDHHNICRIYDYFNDGDRIIIVMEYIEGATLKDVIESEEKLPLNLFLKLGIDLIRIMKYAHDRKMYHRDLKPGNIMVDKQGEIKVIDFGIAKDATDPSETAAGIFSGTPLFAPLEQFSPMGGIDWAKADIYAIGTTLYLMITGRMPFDGKDWDEYADNKRLVEPYPPSSFNPDVSKKLDAILLKSIARLPQDRYNSLGEMLSELEQIRTEKVVIEPSQMDRTVDVAHYPNVTQGQSTGARWGDGEVPDVPKKSRKTLFISIGVVIIAITGGLLWNLMPGDNSQLMKENQVENSVGSNVQIPVQQQPANTTSAKGTLEIVSNTEADIFINDSLVGNNVSAKSIDLDSGNYSVRLENSNAKVKSVTKSASVIPRNKSQLSFQFEFPSKPPQPALGTFSFGINPRGDIYVDNKIVATNRSDFAMEASAGTHDIKIVNATSGIDSTITDRVKVSSGETKSLNYSFRQKATLGFLKVGSWPPKATVFINDKEQSQSTPFIFKLPAGSYNVRVWVKDRDLSQDSVLVVVPGDTVKFAPEFE